jgi:hypothetical protein
MQVWLRRQFGNLFQSGNLEDQEWDLEVNIKMNIKEIDCSDGERTQNLA